MDAPQEPSLLEYARFYGIARDFTAVDPLTYVDETYHTASQTSPLPQNTLSEFQSYIYETQKNVESDLRKEKLNVSKESARLLSSVIQQAKAETIDINWDNILPEFNRADKLKVELPTINTESIMETGQYRSPLRYDLSKVGIRPLNESCQKLKDEDITAALLAKADEVLKDTMPEKLTCSRESMLLIQKARDCSDFPFSDLEGLLEEMIPDQASIWKLVVVTILIVWLQEHQIASKSSPFLLPNFDETYHRSPSPVPMSLTLPNLVCSGSFEPGVQCNSVLAHNSASHTSGCAIVQHPPTAEENQMDIDVLIDERTAEVGTTRLENNFGFLPDKDSHCEEIHTLNVSQQTEDTIYPIDSDSSVICLGSEGECVQTACEVTEERESRTSSVINTGEFQISRSPTSHFSLFSSLSALRLPYLDFVECRNYESDSTTRMCSSNQSNPKGNVAHSQTVQERRTAEEVVETAPSKALESTVEAISAMRYTEQDQFPEQDTMPPQLESEIILIKSPNVTVISTASSSETMFNSLVRDLPTDISSERQKRKYEERPDVSRKDRKLDNQTAIPLANNKGEHAMSSGSSILGSLSTFMETRGRVERRQVKTISPYSNEVQTANVAGHQDLAMDTENPTEYEEPTVIIEELQTSALELCTNHNLPKEADIIVSPTTGIILTTLQATTQLYLPGHKPNPQTNRVKCINSPLRERIYLLAPRYKRLYVFVTHGTSPPKGAQSNILPWPADRRLLASFTSLVAFRDSMSVYSSVSPILVPPSSDTIIEWMLALARKYTFQMTRTSVCGPQSITFTPVNPTLKMAFDIEAMERETCWELFLRRIGLNPYAAQVILIVLRERDTHPGDKGASPDHMDEMGALSRFIEMSSERRQELFPDLIGGGIDAFIEKDWQCDWALKFD
ncbi:uncharacterized protein BDW43DRAFT_306793 [Aspergillus alliaceus]|uniref:uncharacterized protein n=1 Tax=Petromyces alliaceus TaxID=209559 RepID=UPI0012A4E0ED|nr:uncharacterized protein BDW43DRAFT_306793 [Aspergillus alliaceus]KAB8238097.1 hypothetical protein BDW43DRAFT_306793 [Aspergillus alliaceus]